MSEDNKLVSLFSKSDKERFWSKIDMNGANCWEWTAGRIGERGYGAFKCNSRQFRSHRVSWILSHGPIENDLWVLHKCDNPPCCNPNHLFLGTSRDNIDDCIAKGRWSTGLKNRSYERTVRGTRQHLSKLNDAIVREMRRLHFKEGINFCELGRRYGVRNANARMAVLGITWAHVK